jgi:hypothetical protein
VTLLRDKEAAGEIQIIDETPAVFGANALLAASIIEWATPSRD